LATSLHVPIQEGGLVEGNSLMYAFAKILVFGEFLPNSTHDVLLNQLAWAGWTGLFVTALNMLPLGQLDGGHVLYSLLGDRARVIYWPLLLGMVSLALLLSPTWLFFAVLLYFVGRYYAVPLDSITPLNTTRRIIGIVALVIFVLTFTPIPIYQRGEIGGLLYWILRWLSQAGVVGVALLITIPRWMRLRASLQ
jgi:membrane-associated protease RseP (regulator of RpoE activity)